MYVQNPTPLVAEALCMTGPQGAELVVVVVKGTWESDAVSDDRRVQRRIGTPLRLATLQGPVTAAPVYRGEPGTSGLLRDTDSVPLKPGTDCLLSGHAWGGGAREAQVRFTVRSGGRAVVDVHAVAYGPRQWQRTLGLASVVGPVPFESAELAWERAFGGRDASPDDPAHHDALGENPVGVGFRAQGSRLPVDGAWLPQIERPDDRLEGPRGRPRPAGFGPVAPDWEPRRSYAGTYDDAWRRTRAPLLPTDFDPRFYQSAPPELVATPHLVGGEDVAVEGCGPRPWHFQLPALLVRVALVAGPVPEPADASLDTVRVDADDATVELVWRAAFDVHGRVDAVDGVSVHVDHL